MAVSRARRALLCRDLFGGGDVAAIVTDGVDQIGRSTGTVDVEKSRLTTARALEVLMNHRAAPRNAAVTSIL